MLLLTSSSQNLHAEISPHRPPESKAGVTATQRGYNGDWLGGVFSKAVFLGNGLMAILAGLLGHTLVETLGLGPVAPFDAASVVMVIGGAIVLFTWPENYGDSTNKRGLVEQLGSGAKAIVTGVLFEPPSRLLLLPLPSSHKEETGLWCRMQPLTSRVLRSVICDRTCKLGGLPNQCKREWVVAFLTPYSRCLNALCGTHTKHIPPKPLP